MNLIVDIGNTRAKVAVFQNGEIVETALCFKEELKETEENLLRKYPRIKNGIMANVASPEESFETVFSGLPGCKVNLTSFTPVPITNHYQSKDTLGIDRMALATAATMLYPQKNVLVIDTGTCITYDIITAQKDYLGGAISPGLNMRYRGLHNFTANLPLLRANPALPDKIGRTTEASLRLGVTQGVIFEIDGFINRFGAAYSNLTTVLTGGDAIILSKSLKNTIFVPQNFLLIGLNRILEYNKLND